MENIIKQIYQSKELIGIIIPIIVAVIYNFILFVKADEYSRYYGIPIELFDKISIMNIIKYILLIVALTLYNSLPFILNYLFSDYSECIRIYTIVFIMTFLYFYMFLFVINTRKINEKLKWILCMLIAAMVTSILALLKHYQYQYTETFVFIYIIFMFAILIISSFKIIIINTGNGLYNKKTYEIIDGADLKYDSNKIKNSKFAIVYYNKKDILACKCKFDNKEKLIIYKQYLVLKEQNYIKSIITFEDVKVNDPDIKEC